jgi:PAS domain S-box-containing protein
VTHDLDSLADSRLIRAARRYFTLAQDRRTFVWAMDSALRPTGANAAWEEFTGQSRDQYLELGWLEAVHPEDRERCLAAIQANVPEHRPFTLEIALRRHDGVFRRHLINAMPVRDESGSVVEWFGTATDVEAERVRLSQTLAELRELRERLIALTDGAEALLRSAAVDDVRRAVCDLAARVLPADGYAIWSFAPQASSWRVLYSCGLSETFTREEIPGNEVWYSEPFVADSLGDDRLAHRAGAYAREGIASFISVPLPVEGLRHRTLVAYYRTPHVTTESERQVAVALGHLAAAALSNAEQRLREAQARQEAERQSRRMAFLAEISSLFGSLDLESSFRRLAELAVPALGDWCTIDMERDGGLRRVAVVHPNPAMVDLAHQITTRYPVDMAAPRGAGHVLRTGQAEIYPRITDDQLAAGARDADHLRMLRALNLRSALLVPLTARGRTMGVFTLVTTTSDREYDETDLRFVEQVAARAAMAIDNARLYEEAQRANRAKDDFLALLSHELRTPLNAIMGWAQVLLNASARAGDPDSTQARGLEIIRRNAQLQANLVEGLLDVARVATEGLPLVRQPLDLAEAAAAAVEAIRPAASERGLQVQLTVTTACRVFADPNRLQQILSNLLANALKFTERDGRIDVRVSAEKDWATVVVSDTGAGIPLEFLPHVFDRFRQADSSSTRRYGGLGLGLWLVQELVRAHGGTVEVTSEGEGRGSSFSVRLPVI